MRRVMGAALAALMVLTGCSQSSDSDTAPSEVASEEAAAPDAAVSHEPQAAAGGDARSPAIKVSVPQIAYTYRHTFRLPARSIAAAQDRHIAQCDRLGPQRCRIVAMQRAVGDDASASGSLRLVVAAGLARSFGQALVASVAEAGGEQADSSIDAEDLSKSIVDTEARLRAKQALADRLIALLKTRSGPVADLVAAERAVAEVQEEIDAAQSWLAEARGRVAMSTFELSYAGGGGVLSPLHHSVAAIGTLFGQSLGVLIMVLAGVLPWALVLGAAYLAYRYFRRRRRRPAAE